MPAAGGRPTPETAPGSGRSGGAPTASRRLLRRLIEVVAAPIEPQQRLDRIVSMIAADIVAEVCSVYALRAGEILELFATKGLASEAVHRTRLRVGEGLVGTIAATGTVLNTADAQAHPSFVYRPETGEEIYHSFLGVPIVRGGKVAGVLTVQNTARRLYDEDEVDALQVIASVLAEMFASGGLVDASRYADVAAGRREPRRLEGARLVEGVAIGRAWRHEPRIEITRLVADDANQELTRLEAATKALRASVDLMIERSDLTAGEHREVLEAYRMFAYDAGWLRRMREAIETGLSAEAAVRRIQEETRLRIGQANDAYLRERLLDLDDLFNRLLLHLTGRTFDPRAAPMPPNAILVARSLSVAELIDYDRSRIRGIVLEEGSKTAHVTIVARALDIPMIGRVESAMSVIESGDLIALDAESGQVFLRPSEDVEQAFRRSLQARDDRRREFESQRSAPSVTRDGVPVSLSINAAFQIDVGNLDATGADGIGLFRTELAFMTRSRYPDVQRQTDFYTTILDQAAGRPVVFRTIDVGSDKQLPYWRMPPEDNPAMGWRAMRLVLDRPALLRDQCRALVAAARGGPLTVMFPMIAEVAEFDQARALLDGEITRAVKAGRPAPQPLQVGAMLEVPSLIFQLPALLRRVDFLSIGSNDLFQFLFGADRGNPMLIDRYDVLSPPALACLRDIVERCRVHGVRLSLCGEMASKPLEAMVLIGLGIRHLSLAAAEIGPVKAMVRSIVAAELRRYLDLLIDLPDHSLRGRLRAYAQDHGVVLPPGVYHPP